MHGPYSGHAGSMPPYSPPCWVRCSSQSEATRETRRLSRSSLERRINLPCSEPWRHSASSLATSSATPTAQRAHKLLLPDGYQWQKRQNGQSLQMLQRHCQFNSQNTSDPLTGSQSHFDLFPSDRCSGSGCVSIPDGKPKPFRPGEDRGFTLIIYGFNP